MLKMYVIFFRQLDIISKIVEAMVKQNASSKSKSWNELSVIPILSDLCEINPSETYRGKLSFIMKSTNQVGFQMRNVCRWLYMRKDSQWHHIYLKLVLEGRIVKSEFGYEMFICEKINNRDLSPRIHPFFT